MINEVCIRTNHQSTSETLAVVRLRLRCGWITVDDFSLTFQLISRKFISEQCSFNQGKREERKQAAQHSFRAEGILADVSRITSLILRVLRVGIHGALVTWESREGECFPRP